jgi:branched-chain amino acid transport system ATP-binding protein
MEEERTPASGKRRGRAVPAPGGVGFKRLTLPPVSRNFRGGFVLKVVHLCSGYGVLRVIDGISLHANAGEIVALIGANGAGKSTLLKTLAGLVSPQEGRILLRGQDLFGWPAQRIAAAGLTLVPEDRGLFPRMSVLDNLRMGGYAPRCGRRALVQRIEEVERRFPVLRERRQDPAGTLSGGQQQTLALARALIGVPAVLLLDEPSTGLAPRMAAEMFETIRQMRDHGMTILLAEQNVQAALRVADRAYVLQTGKIVLEGPSAKLMETEEIKRAYLGM